MSTKSVEPVINLDVFTDGVVEFKGRKYLLEHGGDGQAVLTQVYYFDTESQLLVTSSGTSEHFQWALKNKYNIDSLEVYAALPDSLKNEINESYAVDYMPR